MGFCYSAQVAAIPDQKLIMQQWKSNYSSSVRSSLVHKKVSDIDDDYTILYEEVLGKGGCGVVHAAEHVVTQVVYAIKICDKATNDLLRLEREILLLKDVDHTNIVRLFSVYKSDLNIHLVMELCSGGHLGHLINSREHTNYNNNKCLDEEWAKLLCRQLLSAVCHIHERGIAHRDIKLQNVLLETRPDRTTQIKLIDFGYGSRFIGCCPMKTHCGTPYTTAPEVFRKSYDERCDVWSVGVVLFIMLSGKRPFEKLVVPGNKAINEAGKAAMTTNILAGRYTMSQKHWGHLSDEPKKFVKTLLCPDYTKRVSSAQAMEIPWIKERTDRDKQRVQKSINLASFIGTDKMCEPYFLVSTTKWAINWNNAHNYSEQLSSQMSENYFATHGKDLNPDSISSVYSKKSDKTIQDAVGNIITNNSKEQWCIQRTGNMALAFGLADDQTRKMRDFFQSIDVDSSGSLSRKEFSDALVLLHPGNSLSVADTNLIFDKMDVNRDDQITFTEFLAATINPEVLDIEEVSQAFCLLDHDGDGFISMSELKKMYEYKLMKKEYSKKIVSNIVRSPKTAATPVLSRAGTGLTNFSNQNPSQYFNGDGDASESVGMSALAEKFENSHLTASSNFDANSQGQSQSQSQELIRFNTSTDLSGAEDGAPTLLEPDNEEMDLSLEEYLQQVLASCDINHDGQISYEEFIYAMTGIGDLLDFKNDTRTIDADADPDVDTIEECEGEEHGFCESKDAIHVSHKSFTSNSIGLANDEKDNSNSASLSAVKRRLLNITEVIHDHVNVSGAEDDAASEFSDLNSQKILILPSMKTEMHIVDV